MGDGESVGELVDAGVAGGVATKLGEALRLGAPATTDAEVEVVAPGPPCSAVARPTVTANEVAARASRPSPAARMGRDESQDFSSDTLQS